MNNKTEITLNVSVQKKLKYSSDLMDLEASEHYKKLAIKLIQAQINSSNVFHSPHPAWIALLFLGFGMLVGGGNLIVVNKIVGPCLMGFGAIIFISTCAFFINSPIKKQRIIVKFMKDLDYQTEGVISVQVLKTGRGNQGKITGFLFKVNQTRLKWLKIKEEELKKQADADKRMVNSIHMTNDTNGSVRGFVRVQVQPLGMRQRIQQENVPLQGTQQSMQQKKNTKYQNLMTHNINSNNKLPLQDSINMRQNPSGFQTNQKVSRGMRDINEYSVDYSQNSHGPIPPSSGNYKVQQGNIETYHQNK